METALTVLLWMAVGILGLSIVSSLTILAVAVVRIARKD